MNNTLKVAIIGVIAVVVIAGIYSAHGQIDTEGTIKIEGIMEQNKEYPDTYYFAKDVIIDFNNSKICPSNHCELIREEGMVGSPFYLGFSEDFMSLDGNYRLKDDITNGHFTPKKQRLVEGVGFSFGCSYDDIQEDLKNGTTKYICSNKAGASLRSFNHTFSDYKVNMTFELPSRHFVLNGEDRE